LESIWKASNSSYCSDTLYRYYGSAQGVFRKFPGTAMPKEYDPTKRPWYSAAIGADEKNKIVVTTPYADVSGVIILTVANTILEGSATANTNSDAIDGVLALDMTLASFYSLLTSEFAPCASSTCFAIDNGGFVIVHPDYINGSPPSKAQHIMFKEPAIAMELFNNGILYNDSCVNIIDVTLQYFWKVNLTSNINLPSGDAIYPVAGSNMFIIVPSPSNTPQGECGCVNQSANGVCLTGVACQCPCYSTLDYDYCTLEILAKTFKPCVPPTSPLYLSDVTTEARAEAIAQDLPACKPCASAAVSVMTEPTTAPSVSTTTPKPEIGFFEIILIFVINLPQSFLSYFF
jgi:hypothetical protein